MRLPRAWTWLSVPALAALAGCPPRDATSTKLRLDPIPLARTVRIVNDNEQRIEGPLRATGRVRGYFTDPRGSRRNFDLKSFVFFLKPGYFGLELKDDLAGRQIVVGSNETHYWLHNKPDGDSYYCRRLDRLIGGRDPDLPIQPAQVIEALGLLPLPTDRVLQRIEEDDQQLMFVAAEEGALLLEKEYWLSRFPPQLISRIVFRDAMGRVEMESSIPEYDRFYDGGPLLPRRILVDWPKDGVELRFDIREWRCFPDRGGGLVVFTPPHERGERFEHEFISE